MKEIFKSREVRAAGAGTLALALMFSGCTASGLDSSNTDEVNRNVQAAPDTSLQDAREQTLLDQEARSSTVYFDVTGEPIYSSNKARYNVTDGDMVYEEELSCNDGDLVVSDPRHPSVEPVIYFGSIVCENDKVTASDWPDVLSQLELGELQ